MAAQLSEDEALALHAQLRSQVGESARTARTLEDASRVGADVALLKQHAPRTYDVVGSADLDGNDYREHGFATSGGFVGTEEPRVLCEAHDDATLWPCPEITVLAERLTGRPSQARPRTVTA